MAEQPAPSRGPKKKGLRGFPAGFPNSSTGRIVAVPGGDGEHVGRSRELLLPDFRAKLCDAMASLEREYEILYLENDALRKKVDELSDLLESHGIRADGNVIGENEGGEPSEAIASTTPPSATTTTTIGISPPPASHRPASSAAPAAVAVKPVMNSPRLVKKLSTSSRVTRLKTTYRAGANKIRRSTAYAAVEVRRCFTGHTDGVWDVDCSPTSSTVATASADHTARLWCTETSTCLLKYLGHSGSVNSVRFHPSLPMACSASGDGQIHIWRLPSSTSPVNPVSKSTSQSNMPQPPSLPLSPSCETVTSLPTASTGARGFYNDMSNVASWAQGQDSHVSDDELNDRLLEEQPENADKSSVLRMPLSHLSGHLGVVIAAQWMADGDHVASASWDRTVKLWDAETTQCVATLTGHDQELTNVSCHPSEKLVLTSARDTTFRMWDLNSFDCHPVHVLQAHSSTVTSAIFSSKGHVISASDDRTVKVWDIRQMRSPTVTIRASTPVNRIAVSRNARLLALPQDNRHLRLFDINGVRLDKSTQKRGHGRMVTSATFLPNDDSQEDQVTMYSVGFDNRLISWSAVLPSN